MKAEIDDWTLLARNKETMKRTLLQELLGGFAQSQTDVATGMRVADPNEAFELRKRALQSEEVALERIYQLLTGLQEQITILEQERLMILSK